MGDLRISDLVVEYSSGGYKVRPIDGLNLDVTAGSLAILLGPSGCGKTTLLSCLGGILRQHPLEILAESRAIAGPHVQVLRPAPAGEERRRGVGDRLREELEERGSIFQSSSRSRDGMQLRIRLGCRRALAI